MSRPVSYVPFTKNHEICAHSNGDVAALRLNILHVLKVAGVFDEHVTDLRAFLQQEFIAHDLENIAQRLWILSTESSSNVNALHRQRVKGRQIIITEEPRLHLLWFHDRIFIKPLPRYMLYHAFWTATEESLIQLDEDVRRAALGFLRTYRYLVRYSSDFAIGQHEGLIPKDITWEAFSLLISDVDIPDAETSKRYGYGEIRLSRLNLYAPILLGRLHYEQLQGQYSDVFARLYGPLLFVFAILSIILNAMQVELTVEQLQPSSLASFWRFCRIFSLATLSVTGVLTVSIFATLMRMILSEWMHVFAEKRRKSKEIMKAKSQESPTFRLAQP